MLLYNIRVLLKTIYRDTEHVANFLKQCQKFSEKCHTSSHRTSTDYQNHGNGGKRVKKNDVAAGPGQEKC